MLIGALIGGVGTAVWYVHECGDCYGYWFGVPVVALGAGVGALVGLLLTPVDPAADVVRRPVERKR